MIRFDSMAEADDGRRRASGTRAGAIRSGRRRQLLPGLASAASLLGGLLAFALAAGAAGTASADGSATRAPAPEGAELYIISPGDGDTVSNPVTVRFGLRGMGVAPAGVERPGTGHHHLLIDTELPAVDEPLPSIPGKVLHFGGGQTETTLELPPGRHTLQLVLGDHNHVPHDPPVVSKRITITVEE